jgi:HPt (histidine-containing phosphotransfer) domain-containing protein
VKTHRLAVAAGLLALITTAYHAQPVSIVSDGIADITQLTIDDKQDIPLDGNWKFYWNEFIPPDGKPPQTPPILLKVRGTWKGADFFGKPLPATGWGSYAILIKVGAGQAPLALRVPSVGTAYALFANGAKIAASGRVAKTADESVARTQPLTATLPPPDAQGRLHLVMHVSNYEDRHGGIWQTVKLGRPELIETGFNQSFMVATFLCGAILLIGLHHIFLYARRRSERSNLAFGLLCLLFALRPLAEGNRFLLVFFSEMPWTLNSRLAYLTFYGSVPLSAWFLQLVFPAQFHRRAFQFVLAISLPACVAVLALPARYYSETLTAFQLFSLAMIVYSGYVIVRAILAGERGAKTLATGLVMLFAGATIDILTVANVLNFPELAPLGLIGFIMSQSVLLSLRQEDAYERLEKLAQENTALISSMEIKILERTAMIAELSAEGDAVLGALSEGVFLIARDQIIGNKISPKILELLEIEHEELVQKSFADVILQITGEALSEDARLFLKVLFNPDMDDDTVEQLNPLSNVAVRGLKSQRAKILQFNFTRQRKGDRIMAAFASCRDITADEKKRAEIEERESRAQNQLEIVRTLFSVSPEALQAFYGSIENELEDISTALSPETDLQVRDRIERAYRAAHTIKGSAQLFKVNFIASQAHAFEDKLQSLLKQDTLENLDLLGVNIAHTELQRALEEFEEMILKILNFQKNAKTMHLNGIDILRDALPRMVSELSEKLGKQAEIYFTDFSPELIPSRYTAALRDGLVQCVRNALAHSIEAPQRRAELGKPAIARIEVSATEKENALFIKIYDDGSSFDIEKIRAVAAERQLAEREDLNRMPDHEIITFIFETGFSTAPPSGAVAGRGAGMDIIARKIRQIGGKLRIRWAKEQFTEFTFVLPKK